MWIGDLIRFSDRSIVVHLTGGVKDDNGGFVSREEAFFLVKNVPRAVVASLKKASFTSQYPIPNATALKKMLAQNSTPPVQTFFDQQLGKRYGGLTGDTNFLHTNRFVARLVGFKNVFVQGLFVFNFLIYHLSARHNSELKKLTVSFIKPVFLNESYQVLATETSVVLSNAGGTPCVIGNYAL